MTTATNSSQPSIAVAQSGAPRKLDDGRWEVAFGIANGGPMPVMLQAAWLPHGRYRCAEQSFDRVPIAPGADRTVAFPVAFDEAPGTVVENAFVILRLLSGEETWRVLARLTVTAQDGGTPDARTELVTAHPVGFSR